MTPNRLMRILAPAASALALLGGCSALPPPPPPDNLYLLEASPTSSPASAPKRDLVLAVSMPHARPGFDTAQMVWVRQPHKLEVYSRNRWADTPTRMLAPLLVQALERSGAFHAVVQTPSPVSAALRLDTELIRLQQDFSIKPSRVQITLSAQLIDTGTRRIIASAEFDETENAESEDAYGGVRAANRALERLLARLVAFSAGHAPPP
ncbi:ABC-type transport auxiliary lipoprotein family protein [Candidatus Ferrigenium straubiae]|jgi:cholesterol transport system auxiliary component|uniref:ABC-type transport auxiliary lipoprotein family protein n=1 Tax=Candidatus Ferrigenium straubiae TaxID=2919506 RepID=UPI003F4AB04E